jgi:toxin-antitoxin system PIN domain toxin
MTFLLDVNILIALIDPLHIRHDEAHRWLAEHKHDVWATCPITENGVLRIVGHPRYPNSPGTPAAVVRSLLDLRALPNHTFWADDVSLLDSNLLDASRLLTSGQITDSYLLALAQAHDGQLATYDHRLITTAVRGGNQSLHVII